jgi:hypothetical protein
MGTISVEAFDEIKFFMDSAEDAVKNDTVKDFMKGLSKIYLDGNISEFTYDVFRKILLNENGVKSSKNIEDNKSSELRDFLDKLNIKIGDGYSTKYVDPCSHSTITFNGGSGGPCDTSSSSLSSSSCMGSSPTC